MGFLFNLSTVVFEANQPAVLEEEDTKMKSWPKRVFRLFQTHIIPISAVFLTVFESLVGTLGAYEFVFGKVLGE